MKTNQHNNHGSNADAAKNELSTLCISTAIKFRLGQEASASQQFRECINLLEPLLKNHHNAVNIMKILPEILASQEKHDWICLADYLEYELPILLKN
ncbi:hypothetical protein Q4591_05325 [Shewanella sp. 3_MG-2023]|uniref:hypothetical protein n=1 Tax=Shewanella sp. 3_MG-2023 TaxID=3062635 RepID=UPI0026E138BE|nr:hypothetical protein [Shewanella sp. 3_MG-2023]MDO6774771.1 hypothetical protein [Shewanella sp. 3_MG-2023]